MGRFAPGKEVKGCPVTCIGVSPKKAESTRFISFLRPSVPSVLRPSVPAYSYHIPEPKSKIKHMQMIVHDLVGKGF